MDIKRWTFGIVLAAAVSLIGLIQADASPFSSFVLSDDLGNRVNGAAPDAGGWDDDSSGDSQNDGGGDSGSGSDGSGSSGSGSDDGGSNNNGSGNGGSKDNNGHGNNEDGVDSSNKGNSKEGEDSDPTVDDEIVKTTGNTK
jgi:hypothetical protein